jgi:hypothetical protein
MQVGLRPREAQGQCGVMDESQVVQEQYFVSSFIDERRRLASGFRYGFVVSLDGQPRALFVFSQRLREGIQICRALDRDRREIAP